MKHKDRIDKLINAIELEYNSILSEIDKRKLDGENVSKNEFYLVQIKNDIGKLKHDINYLKNKEQS